jgi:hypothetical protein
MLRPAGFRWQQAFHKFRLSRADLDDLRLARLPWAAVSSRIAPANTAQKSYNRLLSEGMGWIRRENRPDLRKKHESRRNFDPRPR